MKRCIKRTFRLLLIMIVFSVFYTAAVQADTIEIRSIVLNGSGIKWRAGQVPAKITTRSGDHFTITYQGFARYPLSGTKLTPQFVHDFYYRGYPSLEEGQTLVEDEFYVIDLLFDPDDNYDDDVNYVFTEDTDVIVTGIPFYDTSWIYDNGGIYFVGLFKVPHKGGSDPRVLLQRNSLSVTEGEDVVFYVIAADGRTPYTCQWYEISGIDGRISKVTADENHSIYMENNAEGCLLLKNCSLSQNGNRYCCIMTDANGESFFSTPAPLKVSAKKELIKNITIDGARLNLNIGQKPSDPVDPADGRYTIAAIYMQSLTTKIAEFEMYESAGIPYLTPLEGTRILRENQPYVLAMEINPTAGYTFSDDTKVNITSDVILDQMSFWEDSSGDGNGFLVCYATFMLEPKSEPVTEAPTAGKETKPQESETSAPSKPQQQTEPEKNKEDQTVSTPSIGRVVSLAAQEKKLLSSKKDESPSGSTFSLLQLNASKVSKNYIRLGWTKVPGADRYVIYGNKCGKVYKKLASVPGSTTKWTHKKLKKGTYYKYIVLAVNGSSAQALATSKTIHIATKGGKVGNARTVTLRNIKKKKTLKKGKTFKISASEVAESTKLKIKRHRKLAYESSDSSIAKVSSKGVITAKAKGSCYIYVYAQSGRFQRIKITVK